MKKWWIVLLLFVVSACEITSETDDFYGPTKTGDFTFSVEGFSFVEDTLFGEAPPGERFLAITIVLFNESAQNQTVSSSLMFLLEDNLGHRYDADIFQSSRLLDGVLAPNARRVGELIFSVSIDATTFELFFYPTPFQPGEINVSFALSDID